MKAGGAVRFAIANPEVAPYGRAAEAVLRKRGLWDALRPNIVLGDSIAQAAQFATTGNAVGGLIAYSLVLGPDFADRGTYAVIPPADHPPLRQRMVLLKRAGPIAARFYAYVQTSRPRDFQETRFRSARIGVHGLDGASCLALARRGHSRDSAPVRHLVRPPPRVRQFRGKLLVEALVTVPLVLPPTVLGFYLLVTFGARSPLGEAFQAIVGQSLLFSFEGLLLASAIANIPFVVQPIQRGFEAIPTTCGMPPPAAA